MVSIQSAQTDFARLTSTVTGMAMNQPQRFIRIDLEKIVIASILRRPGRSGSSSPDIGESGARAGSPSGLFGETAYPSLGSGRAFTRGRAVERRLPRLAPS
jgi:hypothetical protein